MSQTSNQLLADVNVARIAFSEDGRTVTLEFLNMEDGRPCEELVASNVVAFNYHNAFVGDEDALPAYVGEVTWQEFRAEESESLLLRMGYGFLGHGTNTLRPKKRCILIHAEGGEVCIDIFCGEYRMRSL